MEIKKSIKAKLNIKKGGSFLLLPFFLLVISCAFDQSQHGRVTFHNKPNQDSFVFSVTDEFVRKNSTSPANKKNPKMTEAEAKLLSTLLKQKSYCLNKYGTPLFHITSRQEKIYDMTFAHLIEQNYNAKAVAPRMYFGRCSKE